MIDLKDAIETISIQQSVDVEKVIGILKDVIVEEFSEFLNVFEEDIVVEVNDAYQVSVALIKEVVEKVEESLMEVSLSAAEEMKKGAKLGDRVSFPIDFDMLKRRDIKHLDRALQGKIKNIRSEVLYRDYKAKEGELINGVYLRKQGRDMFIDIGKVEACLPYWDQSPREKYKQGGSDQGVCEGSGDGRAGSLEHLRKSNAYGYDSQAL